MDRLKTLELESFDFLIPQHIQTEATDALEAGLVIFLPNLSFLLESQETAFLNPHIVDPKSKNISYDRRNDRLNGTLCEASEALKLKEMIKRYSIKTEKFMQALFPSYASNLIQARTSFRPVEASGRIQSYRKDDTRLHVDAFPSSPTHGERIIRFFTNVNPDGKPRVWRLGEPFSDVVKKQAPKTSKPILGLRTILKAFKITKSYRSLYDHYMLQIHDNMKGDLEYQKTVPQKEFLFPPGSSWIVYSDQVSHAAMSGQHMFEQTFHLPIKGMKTPDTSPLKVMEKYFCKQLI
jgi:hypothetical protein